MRIRPASGTASNVVRGKTAAAMAGRMCVCFAWECKGKDANLDTAFNELRQYAMALETPPLLIVSDVARFRIRTNRTNSVSGTHEFTLGELADGATRDKLKWAMSNPERLRPGETRQAVTERAAATFAALAQSLRERGHEARPIRGGGGQFQNSICLGAQGNWRLIAQGSVSFGKNATSPTLIGMVREAALTGSTYSPSAS